MSEITIEKNHFIGYEYKEINVSRSMESVYTDGYHHFGWKLDGTAHSSHGANKVVLKFKRDRKLPNKIEVTRLQRQFEACAQEIQSLEHSKYILPSTAAYSIGLIGTAFMAGSVFAYIGGMLGLSIVLAIPAFIGWIIPYFCYCRLKDKKTAEVGPLIDQKYDELYEVCEKSNTLLNA